MRKRTLNLGSIQVKEVEYSEVSDPVPYWLRGQPGFESGDQETEVIVTLNFGVLTEKQKAALQAKLSRKKARTK